MRRVNGRVVAVEPSRPIVRLVDRHRRLLGAHLLVLAERKRTWVVARPHDFAAVAVAVTLVISDVVRDDALDLGGDVLG